MVTLHVEVDTGKSVRDILEFYAIVVSEIKALYPGIPINVEVSAIHPYKVI